MLDQVISLIEKGHQVRIIAGSVSDEQFEHEEIKRFDLASRVRYLRESSQTRRQRLTLVMRAIGHGGARAAKVFAAFRSARKTSGEIGELATLAAMVLALAEARPPDVVLCHFGPNGSASVRAIEALGWTVPVVTMFHGFDISRLIKQNGPRIYDHLFRQGRLFMPACDAFAERLQALGCPVSRIMVQRMCVSPAKLDAVIAPLKSQSFPSKPFIFVTVGRLVAKKGIGNTLVAFAQAFGHQPSDEVRLRIVGDGPLRDELDGMARNVGVDDKVEFLGALVRSEVLAVVNAADVVVQASMTAPDGDMEASPVVISEAMALRKPVIGTRHSGIPELITDEVTGLLVEEDGEGLVSAMRWMVANRSTAVRMGEAGRTRLEAGLNAEYWNTRLEKRLMDIVHPGTDTHQELQ